MKPEHFNSLYSLFPAGQYSMMKEVRDEAGFSARRSIDVIVVGLWPSRGNELIGIECKSNRGDWLKELKNPAKQESIYKYCDRFYLYCTDESVARLEEVPKTWGYILLNNKGKIKIIKNAPPLKPSALTRSFLATMIKRATEGMIHPDTINDKIKKAFKEGEENKSYEVTRLNGALDALKSKVARFEEGLGMSITEISWIEKHDAEELGAALKYILDNQHKNKKELEKLEEELKKITKTMSGIESLKKALTQKLLK